MGTHRVWTEKDKIDLVHLMKENKTWKKIAEYFQCNTWQVQNYAYSMHLTKIRHVGVGLVLTLRLDPVLLSKLEKRAYEKGLSKSELVRNILHETFSP